MAEDDSDGWVMKIILIPVSPKELEKITITSEQFPVGRQEMPFSNYSEAIQKVLSRRHARIFIQDGLPYIIDMGSSNGTVVNHMEVRDRPHALKHGDQICFANKLTYTVEIEAESESSSQKVTPQNTKPFYLYMTPEDGQSPIDSIVIMSFPFMVSRTDDVFSRYQDDFPEEVNFLSRRHAYIFEKNASLYIEDLKSANGTFVNGEMLRDEAIQLKSGDILSFGGYYFRYHIRIEGGGDNLETDETIIQQGCQQNKPSLETTSAAVMVESVENENKTLFISSATSFLDIFCFQEEAAKEKTGDDDNGNEQKNIDNKASERLLFHKQRIFLQNLVGAFQDGETTRGFNLKIAGLLVLVVITVGVGWYFLNAEKRSITIACDSEDHAGCMEASLAYLSAGNIDGEVAQFAFNAALKRYLPDWIDKVVNREGEGSSIMNELAAFQNDLRNALSIESSGKSENILVVYSQMPMSKGDLPKEMEYFDGTIGLLKNIEVLESFVAQRGGGDGKIKIDKDEKEITDIVDKWQANTDTDRRIMLDIIKQVPEFDELRMLVFSHIRDLRNDKSLYLSAIRSFKERLGSMSGSNENQMLSEVDKLQQKYPRIIGLDAYRDDIKLYQKIKGLEQGSSGKVLNVQELAGQFKTALFSNLYAQNLRAKLPEGDVANHFSQALAQWHDGSCDESIGTLGKIQDLQWVELAQAKINRQKTICQQFEKLNKSRREKNYENTLLQFYTGLEKEEDRYFVSQIEPEILTYKSKLQGKAEMLLKNAISDWENYTRQGKIEKLQLLESDISTQFTEQSKLLVQANQYIDQAKTIYQMLALELTPLQKEKVTAIADELAYQRNALEDLAKTSDSSQVAEAKLKLLRK